MKNSKRVVKKILICSQGSIGIMYRNLLLEHWPRIKICLHSSRSNIEKFSKEKIEFQHSNLEECMKWGPDAAIICNPATYHVDYAIQLLSSNIPVLIEKPIGLGNENLKKKEKILSLGENCIALVGYVLRYEEGYAFIKNVLLSKKLGKLKKSKFVCSSWLPDWRKGIDYRQSVSAQKKLGGERGGPKNL